jgi:putative ABC transport system permease protein
MAEMTALMRMIGRHRMSSVAALAVLAVSIAGATTTFALSDAILWRALPYRDPARLMALQTTHAAGQADVSVPDFTAIRERARDIAVAAAGGFTPEHALTGFGNPRQLRGRVLTGGYFHTLGVSLAAGREFTQAEERSGMGSVAIITDSLRQQLFGQQEALGRILALNGRSYTVVGILPPYRDPTTQRLTVSATDRGSLLIRRGGAADRNLLHLGGLVFHPAGADAVRVRFAPGTPAPSLTIEDGPRQVSAQRLK